jgi:hypothetical protein
VLASRPWFLSFGEPDFHLLVQLLRPVVRKNSIRALLGVNVRKSRPVTLLQTRPHAIHFNRILDFGEGQRSSAYYIDKHPAVQSFVKNAGLGFAVPYLHNGQMHDHMPDFIIRLRGDSPVHLILETKGYDPLEEVNRHAAERWVSAVNSEGTYGQWRYFIARKTTEVSEIIDKVGGEINSLEVA